MWIHTQPYLRITLPLRILLYTTFYRNRRALRKSKAMRGFVRWIIQEAKRNSHEFLAAHSEVKVQSLEEKLKSLGVTLESSADGDTGFREAVELRK